MAWYLDALLPLPCLEAADHTLTLEVRQAVRRVAERVQFDAGVRTVHGESCPALQGQRLRMTLYDASVQLVAGDRLIATVRLRRPWGQKNPGGRDHGLWLIGRGYRATGYIRQVLEPDPVDAAKPTQADTQSQGPIWHRYRHGALLRALVSGRGEAVNAEHWSLFRETGTLHLMVVSGLHVGLFAGTVYLVVWMAIRLLPLGLMPWAPARIAAGFSLLGIVLYAVHVGPQPAVMRAALMGTLVGALLLGDRRVSPWRVVCWAALILIALQPRLLLHSGFWLSFNAVVCLLLVFVPRRDGMSRVRAFLMCQAAIFVGVSPLLGFVAGEVPLIGPVANLLTVPLMSMVTIPAAMLGFATSGISHTAAHAGLWIADASLGAVLQLLQLLRDAAGSWGYFNARQLVQGAAAALALLLPTSWRVRVVACALWMSQGLPQSVRLAQGEFRILVLDVGQASAAIVDTARHRLVVDAGSASGDRYDAGRMIVIPALRSSGRDTLDGIFITHADVDHAGGAGGLLARYPKARQISMHGFCRDAERWQWDGVDFQVLRHTEATSRNERSCTLGISNGRRQAYFSGDIGVAAERHLMTRLPSAVDVLIAPHHGSATSSSLRFVHQLCPRFVIFSAGRLNRYRHPHPAVVARYEKIKAVGAVTGLTGALIWRSDRPLRLQRLRMGPLSGPTRSENCRQLQSSGEFH